MSDLQLILYDDDQTRNWFPFTLTRPAGELWFGAYLLRQRAERVFAAPCLAHLTDAELAGFDEPGAPPVIGNAQLPSNGPLLLLSARAVLREAPVLTQAGPLILDDQVVGWYSPDAESRADPRSIRSHGNSGIAVKGQLLNNVWELMSRNAEQLAIDIAARANGTWSELPGGVAALGTAALVLGRNVTIEPNVVLDFSEGPIWFDDDVTVRSFTRLAGPAYIGKGSTLFGGSYTAVSIGPGCKIRGEVESTVVLGYSNKAHDGFLGHAYLGKWVNLGALTTNSDLKNNYGAIRLWTPQGEVNTGEMKIGCLLGDHVKTAIGTMLNTGTVVGPGSNIFGGPPPKFLPPFSWGSGEYDFDKFIETAEVVMARRKQMLTEKQRNLLNTAWQRGRALANS